MEHTGVVVFCGLNGSGKSLFTVQAELNALDGIEWVCFDIDHRHHDPFRQHAKGCATCDVGTFLAHHVTTDEGLEHGHTEGVICAEGQGLIAANARGDRLVYSTVPLTESRGVPARLYRPLVNYQQLLTIEHADVIFDEVAGIADSSSSASMPVQVINWQHKLRKGDIRQRVTTPAYARCALPIRQVAQVVVECRGFAPTRTIGKLWRPRRIVQAKAYDAFAFEDFIASEGQRNRLKPLAKALIWVPKSEAIHRYNSFGQVLQLGHINEAGMCMNCGGSRARPKCACDLGNDAVVDLVIEETVSASGTRTRRAVRNEE